jgi:hypothetical protein
MVNSDWVFRHAGNCVIEFPPLELPAPPPGSRMHAWVATLWRDPTSPTGWTALRWVAADRGWELPRHLAIGDVIEFGLAALNSPDLRPLAGWDLRWRCWLRYCNDLALVVDGPYPTAPAAAGAANETLAELRLRQLTGPEVEPTWQFKQTGCGIETEP